MRCCRGCVVVKHRRLANESPSMPSPTGRSGAAASRAPHIVSSTPGNSSFPPRLGLSAPAMPRLHARIPHAKRGYFDAPRVVPELPPTFRSFTTSSSASAAQWPPR
jgi:hypothetical protein